MDRFDTALLDHKTMRQLSDDAAANIYNGLDCCVTLEIYEVLMAELADEIPEVQYTYEMAMAKQAPILEMSMRGILVDEASRKESVAFLEAQQQACNARFQRILTEVFDHGLNAQSPVQLKTFFYGELGIKEIKKRNTKGVWAATTNDEALRQLMMHPIAEVFARYVLTLRSLSKKLSFLRTEIDSDHRIRANFNVAGTNTGRLSSAFNDFGTGTNLQNIDTELRYPFIADPKRVLVNTDLEQADARNVGAIIWNTFLDQVGAEQAGAYLDACESGDLHTTVCRMSWVDLAWPEDRAGWRAIADSKADGEESYRQRAKKLGHGTNYYGQPQTMAKHTHTRRAVIEDFQRAYFRAFPLIPEWHKHTITAVKTSGVITTLYGRRRNFFGRGDASSTWREAIAYAPQSMTGHQIDMGLLNLWRNKPEAELLAQVHDSILFQVPWHNHQTHVEQALELLRYETELKGGRRFFVPLGCKTGWNWGDYDKKQPENNPFGVKDWSGEETRKPPAFKRLSDYL
jgi:DNA polymerase-1